MRTTEDMMMVEADNGNGHRRDSSLDQLRRVRAALRAAVDDGADYLRPLFDEVEDELVDALNRRGRLP